MPYSGPSDNSLPSNVQRLSEDKRRKWVATFNSVFNECEGDKQECESKAFRIANGTIKGVKMPKTPEDTNLDLGCSHQANEKCMLCQTNAVTWSEVEEAMDIEQKQEKTEELFRTTEILTQNVMRNPEIDPMKKPNFIQSIMDGFIERLKRLANPIKSMIKQVSKTEDGVDYKASDYAVVPDKEKPSTWKLRLAENSSGNFTVQQVASAITAMQPGGFRGQRAQLTPDEKTQAISSIGKAINKVDGTDDQKENLKRRLNAVKEIDSDIWITKDTNGDMRWFGFVSNKWRDRDNPPQIIEEAAHKDFVKAIDNKEVEMPELLSWHTPGTRIGVADTVDYINGFLVMGGPIDKDKYEEAEVLALKCQNDDIGMSHGFVYEYSDKDNEVIGKYRTWEVSHLPRSKAANVWTSINIKNKGVMDDMFNPEKRKYLVDLHGEDAVTALENKAADLEKDLVSMGAEFKELGSDIAVKTARAIIESEAFKEMKSDIDVIKGRVDALEATANEAVVIADEAKKEAKKSVDDIVSEAWSTESKIEGFQASQKGEEPNEEEKKEAPFADSAYVGGLDANLLSGIPHA